MCPNLLFEKVLKDWMITWFLRVWAGNSASGDQMYTSTIGSVNMLRNLTTPKCSVVLLIRVNLEDFGNPLYSTRLELIYRSCQIWSFIEDQEMSQVGTESNSAFNKTFYSVHHCETTCVPKNQFLLLSQKQG